jgi:ribonuclease VapC
VTDYVFDSFALTAYVQNEPAGVRVKEFLDEAKSGTSRLSMTTVNLGETLYVIYRRRGPQGLVEVLNLAADLPIELANADLPLTVTAARIKAVTPIAYGDCFAAALALHRGATVVTGDREFERLKHLITIEWLPGARY